jgi:hypothetical protein
MTGDVNVLSISDGPCHLAVIFSSSPSGEILTVSDAAGEEDGGNNHWFLIGVALWKRDNDRR